MDNNWLLVKCITLLYRESLIEDKTENSSDTVRTILESIKLPEMSLSINHDREKYIGLKEVALYMCNQKLDYVHEKIDLLQTLKLKCGNDENLFNVFVEGIDKDMDEGSLKRTVLQIKKQINDYFRENQAVDIINRASIDLKFNRVKIKEGIREYIKNLISELEPYQIESNRKDPAVVDSVDIGDESSLNEVFNNVKDDVEGSSLMITGWQDLNDLLQGGFRRGESWIVPALQHKYKTGFTLSIFRQIAQYNTPIMINPNKKPLLLRISFEDELVNNLRFIYQNLWENEYGVIPDLNSVSAKEMTEYVRTKLQANGYHIKLMRVNPSEWTYKDIQNTVLELESKGYEIHLLMVDYLYKIPTIGCTQGPMGSDVTDLFDRIRHFCSARKITFITPHQFSTEAKQLVRDGHSDFVKKICELGYFEGSKKIDQVVDGEIYIHIEKKDNASYLTVQRGKHRIPNIIPESQKYFVLPFPKKGTILDDLNKPKISLSKVGGGPKGSSNEIPFFEFDDREK